jgi:hypothetical protein
MEKPIMPQDTVKQEPPKKEEPKGKYCPTCGQLMPEKKE